MDESFEHYANIRQSKIRMSYESTNMRNRVMEITETKENSFCQQLEGKKNGL
jgi:hypothetical protein